MSATKQPDPEKTRKRVVADYQRGKKPKELSEKYGVNINTVKSWIKRDAAKRGASEKGATGGAPKRKRGAPKGNTNAVGGNGGAPLGNTNALKHGGYSAVYWDTLTEEEQRLLETADYDGEQLLLDEIALLSIRERRIMALIKAQREAEDKGHKMAIVAMTRNETKRDFADKAEEARYNEIQKAKIEAGEVLPGRPYRLSTHMEATFDVMHRLEDALSRCQAQKQRCIQSLNELRIVRGDDGKRAPENNLLQALLTGTAEAIDTDDIQELQQATEHSDDVVEPPES